MEAQNTEKRDSEKQKKSKAGRAVAIAVIILLLLALIVCLIIIFTHRHTMTHYAYAEATCTAGGNAEYWYCAGCDGYFEDEEGENEVEFSGLILPAAGHEWMAASCNSPRRCNICGYSDGAALGHSWGDYEFSPSDCGSEGAILRVCTACGEVERIAVPVHGNAHNWGSIAVVQPSCVSAGRAVLTCADCGETVSSVIPATGAHHWDDGKITMPGCTGTGSIIHTCIDCGATETDVIPASGHVWISAGCTSPVTCAVCGATSGSALGHKWSDWTAYSDVHMRECETCGISEVEAHDFTAGDTCSVCSAAKPAAPATDPFHGVDTTIVSMFEYVGQSIYYDEIVQPLVIVDTDVQKNYVDMVGGYVGCGYHYESEVTLSGVAEDDINISMQMVGLVSESATDLYVVLHDTNDPRAEEEDITKIAYHPMRWYIEVYQNGAYVPVKFCSGCANCNSCSHANPEDVYSCATCQNCYYRTIGEIEEYLNSPDSLLNISYKSGETVDFKFKMGWDWAFDFDVDYNQAFEIRGADGTRYYFTNSYSSPFQYNVNNMDTVLGQDPSAFDKDVFDTTGKQWYMQADDFNYIYYDCWLQFNIDPA